MHELRQRVGTLFSLSSRLLWLVWEANPRYALLALLLTIATGAVPPAQIWISKLILDQIVGSVGQAAGLTAIDWYAILTPTGWIFVVWTVGALCQAAATHQHLAISGRHAGFALAVASSGGARVDPDHGASDAGGGLLHQAPLPAAHLARLGLAHAAVPFRPADFQRNGEGTAALQPGQDHPRPLSAPLPAIA